MPFLRILVMAVKLEQHSELQSPSGLVWEIYAMMGLFAKADTAVRLLACYEMPRLLN